MMVMFRKNHSQNYPICSMYGIFTNIYPINDPNVGKYTIHGAHGYHNWPWNDVSAIVGLVFFC